MIIEKIIRFITPKTVGLVSLTAVFFGASWYTITNATLLGTKAGVVEWAWDGSGKPQPFQIIENLLGVTDSHGNLLRAPIEAESNARLQEGLRILGPGPYFQKSYKIRLDDGSREIIRTLSPDIGLLVPPILNLIAVEVNGTRIEFNGASFDSAGPIVPLPDGVADQDTLSIIIRFRCEAVTSFSGPWFSDGQYIGRYKDLIRIQNSILWFQKYLAQFSAACFFLLFLFLVSIVGSVESSNTAREEHFILIGLCLAWCVFFIFLSGAPRSHFPNSGYLDVHYIAAAAAYHMLLRLVIHRFPFYASKQIALGALALILVQIGGLFLGKTQVVYRFLFAQHCGIVICSIVILIQSIKERRLRLMAGILLLYSALILSDSLKLNRDLFGIEVYPLPFFARIIASAVLVAVVIRAADLFSRNRGILLESSIKEALYLQVAHDIRSPLATVNAVIATAKGLKDEDRDMLKRAVHQIQNIAEDVLGKKTTNTDLTQTELNPDSLVAATKPRVEWVLYQLETEYSKQGRADIELDVQSPDLFCEIPGPLLYRTLSNLINNAIESYPANARPRVKLSLGQDQNVAVIRVQDFGSGIPESVLSRIGERGFTHGKNKLSTSGSGLGVFSAREAVQSLGGSLKLESKENEGTTVTVRIPTTAPPGWFTTSIDFRQYDQVICADDNQDIRALYEKKLNHPNKRILKTTAELKEQMRMNVGAKVLFMVDYDFNESTTGLDLIEMFDAGAQSILVTGLASDETIQARCEKIGCRLVAKGGLDRVLG